MKDSKDIKIKYSKRTRVRFPKDEFEPFKKFVAEDPAAYSTIEINTGVRRLTVVRLIENGYTELQTARKLKPFITVLKQTRL